jgi:iron(III) transport system permease protein
MTDTAIRPQRPAGRSLRPPAGLLLPAVLVALISLIPLGYVVFALFQAGPDQIRRLLLRARVAELLVNTGLLTVLTMAGCAVLGIGCAWLVERTTLPGGRIWAGLLVAPLAVPAFVTSYGWTSAFPGIDGLGGATLIMTLAYFPLVFLPVAGALRNADPAWEEQARSLGLGAVATFRRVTLPQLRPAIVGGSLLVGLHCLAEFGAFQGLKFSTFTTAIYEQYQSSFAGPAANMLAVALLVCSLLLVTGETFTGRRRISRVGSGAPRAQQPWSPARGPFALLAIPAAVVGAALVVPVASVFRWLTAGGSAVWDSQVAQAALSTAELALGAAAIVTALAFPAAYLVSRHRSPLTLLIERAGYLAGGLPSIVVGLALVSLTVHYVKPIYQTWLTLLLAYLILFLPRALVGVRAGLAQSRPELEEASGALGLGRFATLRRVTIPLAAPGIATSAALVFLATATELTATLMLSPIGVSTLATRFWSLTGGIDYVAAAPYATLIIIMSIPVTLLLLQQSRRALGR